MTQRITVSRCAMFRCATFGSTTFLCAIASGLVLSSCTRAHSVPAAAHAPTQFSFRQVYESNDPGLPGTEIGDVSPGSAGPTTTSPAGNQELAPSAAELAAYAALDCSTPANQRSGIRTDDAAKFLATCGNGDESSTYFKYLLRPSLIRGSDISVATAQEFVPATGWDVQLTFTPGATSSWAKFTASHVGTAVVSVVDGNVFVAEIIQAEIVGPTVIDGTFTKKSATALAKLLSNGNAR
jgi:preprotein translocase subunit SecD